MLVLDQLGWLTDGLYDSVPFTDQDGRRRDMGKYLVTNRQYRRFLEAEDFGRDEFWADPSCVAPDGRPHLLVQSAAKAGDKPYPKMWNDSKFGVAYGGLPVVGLRWYEANAYCRWLRAHWGELEEGLANPAVRPSCVRLPSESEWSMAVYGSARANRLPWSHSTTPGPADYLSHANIGGILDRTSPVGMFPQGASYPLGLVDVCGNAWEWQSNLYDYTYSAVALRGGAFTSVAGGDSPRLRGWLAPADQNDDVGFRILVEEDEV